MAKGSFVISAENKIKEGLDAAQRDLEGFSSSTQRIGDAITKALTVTAIVAGLKKLGDAAIDCYKEFGEMDRRMQQLRIALNNNEVSFTKAVGLIDKLSSQTLASKDDIESLVAELASLGKSDKEIDAIATAAVNLSNVTGQNLDAAFRQINGTYAGTIGRLAQLIPEVKNLTTEQLTAGEAVKLINDRFGELSKQLAEDNIPQKLKNIKDTWGDLRESIGQAVAPIFNPFLDGINRIITGWNNAIKAAQIHKQLLTTSAWDVKISLNEELLAMNTSRLEELAKLMKPLEKSTGGNMTLLRQNQQYMAWASEKTEIEQENAKLSKEVAALKAQIAANPGSPFAGSERVPSMGGTTGGATKPVTVEDLLSKFAPILTGPLSAGGYRFNKQEYEQFGKVQPDIPIDESKWAAIANGPMSALGYALEKALYDMSEEAQAAAFAALDELEAAYKTKTGTLGQSGLIPSGMAEGRSDFAEQLLGALQSTLKGPQYGQSGITPEGLKPAPSIADQMAELAKTANPFTEEEAEAYANVIVDIMGTPEEQGAAMARAYLDGLANWNLDKLQAEFTTPQTRLAPEGFAPRDDFAEQLLDQLQGLFTTAVRGQSGVTPPQYEGQDAILTIAQQMLELAKTPAPMTAEEAQAYASVITEIMGTPTEQAIEYANNRAQDYIDYQLEKLQAEFTVPQVRLAPEGYGPRDDYEEQANAGSFLNTLGEGLSSAFDTVTAGMGNFASSLLGPLSEIMAALGPFGQMIAGMNPLLALLIPVIEGFAAVLAPALTAVIQPLMDALTMLGTMLGQALLPILDALAPIVSLIASILMTVLAPVIQMLAPIIQAIVIILQPFSGIIATLAKVFTILMAPVQWLADLFSWVGEVLKTFAWNIMHPFRQQSGPGSFYSDAFSGLSDRLAAIDALATNNQTISSAVSPSSASTASQSASYRTQQITINIYQQAPVVGSGGMDEFVGMIRTRFNELAYFGATA